MTIGKNVLERLRDALEHQPSSEEGRRYFYNQVHQDLRVQIMVAEADRFSSMLDRVQISPAATDVPKLDFAALSERAEQLVERLTYLVENLAIIEADSESQKIQIRSSEPRTEGERRSYFEIILDAGRNIALRRFESENGLTRQVPFHVTDEVLQRLLDDLAVAVT